MCQILNDGVSLQKTAVFTTVLKDVALALPKYSVKHGVNCYQEIYFKKFCDTEGWG